MQIDPDALSPVPGRPGDAPGTARLTQVSGLHSVVRAGEARGLEVAPPAHVPRDLPQDVTPVLVDQIIEKSPIGIAVIDVDGNWHSVNPAYCALYGYTRDEMVGRDFTQVFAPELRERVMALHRRFLSQGGELRGEWEVVRRDGAVVNIISESVRVPGEGGRPRRLVYVVDITEIKQAREAARRGEALLLDLAASIPGAMFRLVHRGDDGWRFTYFSPGVHELFEVMPERACQDTRALRQCIVPEDLPAHDASIQQAVAQGSVWKHEYRIRTASGRLKWIHALAQRKPSAPADEAHDDDSERQVWTGVLTDVTERKALEAVLKASEATYRTLFETVPQGVIYHDAAGRITSANPAAQRILGLSLTQMQGLTPVDPSWHAVREDGSDFPGEHHPAMVALRTGQPVRNVVMGVAVPAQGYVWILVNAIPLPGNGRVDEVYASFEDITQRVMLARELQHQASTDVLTGAANRRSLMERLRIEFDRVQRHTDLHCSLLALDLDHFKAVNDRWGHAAGDAVLRHVTELMRQDTRQIDVVARSGGEEFTLLLPDTTQADAQALADRLRRRIEDTPTRWHEQVVSMTVSIGVSAVLGSDIGLDEVLARADRALYRAKAEGRNRVCSEPGPA
jgi:diguanylate cyclase (GGDEF)-like protein/PAS domain S-box-containing protein